MEFTTKLITKSKLPLVIEPTKSFHLKEFLELIRNQNEFFKKNLLEHGGLLLRGFPINDANDFASVIEALNVGKFMNYIGGDSPRNKIREGVFTSTEAPPSVKIPLHNELSFVNKYPKHIFFYCHVAPQDRGETIIGDARKVFQDVDHGVKDRFIHKKLKYVSRYYHKKNFISFLSQNAHKSWTDVFETSDKKEVERLCKENDFQFKWNPDNWLEISQIRPATMIHPITKENIWFNQAHLFDFNPKFLGWFKYLGTKLLYSRKYTKLHDVYFADGSEIPREDLYHIMDVLDTNTLAFPWQKGDVLVLDNGLSMHGRATFTGPRKIYTAMTG